MCVCVLWVVVDYNPPVQYIEMLYTKCSTSLSLNRRSIETFEAFEGYTVILFRVSYCQLPSERTFVVGVYTRATFCILKVRYGFCFSYSHRQLVGFLFVCLIWWFCIRKGCASLHASLYARSSSSGVLSKAKVF